MLKILVLLAFAILAPQTASAFSDEHTAEVVTILKDGETVCGQLETVYQFDCYRQSYRDAGDAVRNRPDYNKARAALKNVERGLSRTVRQNADKTRPAIRVAGRTVKPIRPDAVPAATRSFDMARAEAVTQLVRSEGKARIHYTRIADVVGSNKVIIRSWLMDRRARWLA